MAGEVVRRVALVTGANRGIGLEVCRQLCARGWRVFLGARDTTRAMRLRAASAATSALLRSMSTTRMRLFVSPRRSDRWTF